jgi:hypothetical protein
MPNQRECDVAVRQPAAYYEVVVAMHQKAAIVNQLVLYSF